MILTIDVKSDTESHSLGTVGCSMFTASQLTYNWTGAGVTMRGFSPAPAPTPESGRSTPARNCLANWQGRETDENVGENTLCKG